jgi:hypothetical protein
MGNVSHKKITTANFEPSLFLAFYSDGFMAKFAVIFSVREAGQ